MAAHIPTLSRTITSTTYVISQQHSSGYLEIADYTHVPSPHLRYIQTLRDAASACSYRRNQRFVWRPKSGTCFRGPLPHLRHFPGVTACAKLLLNAPPPRGCVLSDGRSTQVDALRRPIHYPT